MKQTEKCPLCGEVVKTGIDHDCTAESDDDSKPEPASEETLRSSDGIGALVKDMEREEDAAWVAAREADRKDDLAEYNKQLATARTWQAAVRKLRSKMESAPTVVFSDPAP